MGDAVAAVLEQGAKTIAIVRGVDCLKEGIAEKRGAVGIGSDQFFVFKEIEGEVGVTCLLAIELVRIGMIADEVARLVPCGKQLGAVGFIHAHPANEQRGPDIFRGNRFQNAAVGFLPSPDGTERERRIVECEGHLGPPRTLGANFLHGAWWKWKGSQATGQELGAHRGGGGFYCMGGESATFPGNDLNENNLSKL